MDTIKKALQAVRDEITKQVDAAVKARTFGNLKALATVDARIVKIVESLEKTAEAEQKRAAKKAGKGKK